MIVKIMNFSIKKVMIKLLNYQNGNKLNKNLLKTYLKKEQNNQYKNYNNNKHY